MPINPFATEDDPDYQQQGASDATSMLAQQRLERLKQGYPTPNGMTDPNATTNGGGLMDLISRFLHQSWQGSDIPSRFLRPGSQTTPNTPKRNLRDVEEDVK